MVRGSEPGFLAWNSPWFATAAALALGCCPDMISRWAAWIICANLLFQRFWLNCRAIVLLKCERFCGRATLCRYIIGIASSHYPNNFKTLLGLSHRISSFITLSSWYCSLQSSATSWGLERWICALRCCFRGVPRVAVWNARAFPIEKAGNMELDNAFHHFWTYIGHLNQTLSSEFSPNFRNLMSFCTSRKSPGKKITRLDFCFNT